MLPSQPPLVALTIAGNVHGMPLLQLCNLLLDLIPPARHPLSVAQTASPACRSALSLQVQAL